MKKTYISPETSIHKLEIMNLLAGSPVVPLSDDPADPEEETLSRRRGRYDWDDEDEEDDW
jgi:hypothetical protein